MYCRINSHSGIGTSAVLWLLSFEHFPAKCTSADYNNGGQCNWVILLLYLRNYTVIHNIIFVFKTYFRNISTWIVLSFLQYLSVDFTKFINKRLFCIWEITIGMLGFVTPLRVTLLSSYRIWPVITSVIYSYVHMYLDTE